MATWEYKGRSPAKGKIYHKKDKIMIVYATKFKLFCGIPKDKPMLPAHSKEVLIRYRD